jgi:hypothetical protein
MGQEKCTGEIKNIHKILVGNLETKCTFGDIRLEEYYNVMNWT